VLPSKVATALPKKPGKPHIAHFHFQEWESFDLQIKDKFSRTGGWENPGRLFLAILCQAHKEKKSYHRHGWESLIQAVLINIPCFPEASATYSCEGNKAVLPSILWEEHFHYKASSQALLSQPD
jgi:hypothetical protein